MESLKLIAVYCLLGCFKFKPIFSEQDSISPNQSIHNNETLISAAGTFEAGFFGLGNPQRQYFGIWYKNISPRTVVWVANRDTPIATNQGVLKLADGGILVILDGSGATIWSSDKPRKAEKPALQLLESGNLVVKEVNMENILWESFDYPGDTFLPGMKITNNLVTGQYRSITSWKDMENPAPGDFSHHMDTHGFPQLVTTKGQNIFHRVGSWNGYLFTGCPQRLHKFYNFSFEFTGKEISYQYSLLNRSLLTRVVLTPTGFAQRFIWSDSTENWELANASPADSCEYYAFCGANSNCDVNDAPACECLKGFKPKSEGKWDSHGDGSGGCVRRMNLSCDSGDGFEKYGGMKLPDTSNSWFNMSMRREECRMMCLRNCSCTAYADLDVRDGGSGCLLWFGDIVDLKRHDPGGQDIYIRLAASEIDMAWSSSHFSRKKRVEIIVASATFIAAIIIVGLVIYLRKKELRKSGTRKIFNRKDPSEKNDKENIDLPVFDLSTITIATNHFSVNNMLGEGGFGPVYKGILPNGQEIAVKRHSKKSRQGSEEFENEVLLIANLQHRNLVKLFGCCIQDDERLLIYEFMPNRSLDYFIFDQTRSNLLDWNNRFQIIGGIARGLLYLHQNSRLRIIHRDLKINNILLDSYMNPKISDFGLARTFGEDQAEANTNRIVGTYGYMPPEYVMRELYSMKSDVFSFGVIILEIISGRKNREFYDHSLNLLGHAWRLWSEERPLEIMDECLSKSASASEALRCIQVGLLCVQERSEDRPHISSAVLMLSGEKALPKPRQPAFYLHQVDSSPSNCGQCSSNRMSISKLEAR